MCDVQVHSNFQRRPERINGDDIEISLELE